MLRSFRKVFCGRLTTLAHASSGPTIAFGLHGGPPEQEAGRISVSGFTKSHGTKHLRLLFHPLTRPRERQNRQKLSTIPPPSTKEKEPKRKGLLRRCFSISQEPLKTTYKTRRHREENELRMYGHRIVSRSLSGMPSFSSPYHCFFSVPP